MRRLKETSATTPARPAALDRLAIIAIYLAGLLGAVLCWMLEYNIPFLSRALLGAGMGAVLFIAALMTQRPVRWIIVGGAAGIWVAVTLAQWAKVVQGALFAADLVYSRFTEVFVDFQTVMPPDDPEGLAAFATFLVLAGFLLAALLAGTVLALRSLLLTILVTLPFFWFAFANTGLPPFVPTLLLICCWCGLLFRMKGRTDAGAKLRLAAMGLCAVLVVTLAAAFPAARYKEDARVLEVRSDLQAMDWEKGLSGIFNFAGTRRVAGRTTTRVNLSATGNLSFTEGTALSVKGHLWQEVYLRGFACSDYTGRAWRQGNGNDYEAVMGDYSPLANDWYHRMNDVMFPKVYRERYNISTYQPSLTVRLTEELPYSPVPYGVETADAAGEELAYVRDAFLAPAPGGAEYEAQGMYYYSNGSIISSEQPLFPYSDSVLSPDITMEQLVELEEYSGTTEIPEEYFVDLTLTLDEMMTDEERRYIEYISQAYTALPDGLDETLRSIAAEQDITPADSYEDWHRTAYLVSQYLRHFGQYTRTPGNQPVGADFAEYFLTTSQRGYCVHYASAGATMLRALGVPARYVEGFVVSRDLLDTTLGTNTFDPGVWVDVPNGNAHAWVEIWEPGAGWLPVEMTPGGGDYNHPEPPAPKPTTPGGGQDPGASSGGQESSSSEAVSSSSVPQSSSSSSVANGGADGVGGSGGAAFRLPGWAKSLLVCIAIVAVAFVVLVAVQAVIRKRRAGRFATRDTNSAAIAIYTYLEALATFGATPSEEAYALACKAKFSQHTLTGEERDALLREARQTRERLRQSLPLPKRLWLWLRGL